MQCNAVSLCQSKQKASPGKMILFTWIKIFHPFTYRFHFTWQWIFNCFHYRWWLLVSMAFSSVCGKVHFGSARLVKNLYGALLPWAVTKSSLERRVFRYFKQRSSGKEKTRKSQQERSRGWKSADEQRAAAWRNRQQKARLHWWEKGKLSWNPCKIPCSSRSCWQPTKLISQSHLQR